MIRTLTLLTTYCFAALAVSAAQIEIDGNERRLLWRANDGVVYLTERSTDLKNWEAIGPIFIGDDTDRSYAITGDDGELTFYRLLRIPRDNVKTAISDGVQPNYLGWVNELADGALQFNFRAFVPSDFADVHYQVNGGSQLNLRMEGSSPHFTYTTPALAEGDEISFYYTYDREGPVEDTPSYTHTFAGDNSSDNPDDDGGDDTGGNSDYEDVLPAPLSYAGYSHGVDFTDGQATIRIEPGTQPESIRVHYQINGDSVRADDMTQAGDEWQYTINAEAGDTLAYYFYSSNPNHIRSATFTRVLGTSQPTEVEPLEIIAAGRFRDRHENETRFNPYVEDYFDGTHFGVRLIDYGTGVDVEVTPAGEAGFVDLKLYDRNTTPHEERPLEERADYAQAIRMFERDGKYYWRIEPVEPGKFVDLEFTIQRASNSQTYYTAIFRFYVGDGALTQRITDPEAYSGGATSVDVYSETEYSFAQFAHNAHPETLEDFLDGKQIFDEEFTVSTGLGPLYNAKSCFECHINDGSARPPVDFDSAMNGMLFRLGDKNNDGQPPHSEYGAQLQDRAIDGHYSEGRGHVIYDDTPGQFGDGSAYSLADPQYSFSGLQGPGFLTAVASPRVAPKIIGMGLLEAIPVETLESWEDPDDLDGDGVSGRINWVTDPESGETVAGRFGWKASQPSVRTQTAIALTEDIGVSNPIYPESDTELSSTDFELLAHYTKLLGVPLKRGHDSADAVAGQQLFGEMGCVACHVPTTTTAASDVLTELSGQRIHPYSDLLLHDMGDGLADDVQEGNATGREWRTAPLWGIGRTEEVSGHSRYLHDGRARNLTEAILWHGGEAESAKENFRTLSADDRAKVIAFLKSL
ncbi:di-heme oxidoredictase family protein [Cerasicoccus maritimus]|uniref:di-heme oxidoreductase family protein n=1 Tax=Cerasicoccus maritimus TaxID=490089 RepID=UPI002852D6B5|nr:di-heme oxidoredictase family protein [Cerasicoccus maritimus]